MKTLNMRTAKKARAALSLGDMLAQELRRIDKLTKEQVRIARKLARAKMRYRRPQALE